MHKKLSTMQKAYDRKNSGVSGGKKSNILVKNGKMISALVTQLEPVDRLGKRYGYYKPELFISKQPPKTFFLVGGNREFFTFTVSLRMRFLERGNSGELPLAIHLCYDNGYRVADQCIMEFEYPPVLNLAARRAEISVRICEPSAWPRHKNKWFHFNVSTNEHLAGEKVIPCRTNDVHVVTKSIQILKDKMKELGIPTKTNLFEIRDPTGVIEQEDQNRKFGITRKDVTGHRVISSGMTIAMDLNTQRKTHLRRRYDRHMSGTTPKKQLPSKAEQQSMFKAYNSWKQSKSEKRKSKEQMLQDAKYEDKHDDNRDTKNYSVRKKSLTFNLIKSSGLIQSLKTLIPASTDSVEESAPSIRDDGLWKKKLGMYRRPAELDLARHYFEDEKYPAAAKLCESGIKLQKDSVGPEHPLVSGTLLLWGRCLRGSGKIDDSMKKFKVALEIRYMHYKTIANVLCMEVLDEIAKTYARGREFREARNLYVSTIVKYAPKLGARHDIIVSLQQKANKMGLRSELYQMKCEDHRSMKRYEWQSMISEDFLSHDKNKLRLQNILLDPLGLQFFRIYSTKFQASMQVDFWIAVEHYRKLKPKSDAFIAQIKKIFFEYVQPPHVLPMLSEEERSVVRSLLSTSPKVAPNEKTFDIIQGRVLRALANSILIEFEDSDEYSNYIEAQKMMQDGILDTDDESEEKQDDD